MSDYEKIACEICDKKSWVLYPIIFGRDHFMTPRRGVCKECFNKVEDLDALILKRSKKLIENSIKEKTDAIKSLQKELDEMLNVKEEIEE